LRNDVINNFLINNNVHKEACVQRLHGDTTW
jgi:hypothetical protein